MNEPGRKILFSGHDLRFIRPFISWCRSSLRWEVLLDEHQGHEITNPSSCLELLSQANVIFCEWCLGNAVWYSKHKLPGQKLVVRLHEQEMRLPFLDRIDWSQVEALILICPGNLAQIRKRYPSLRDKTHLIYNPIETEAFDQEKLPGAEFNLGIMGICPMRKRPDLAFEIFERLKKLDGRHTLYVKGKHPRDYDWLWRRPEERAYYEKLFARIEASPFADSVVFETYGDDVPTWFSKIGFILSTSDFEGSHQAVAEGMAAGAIPVIRNWAGARELYAPKYLFSTVEDAVRAVLQWRTQAPYLEEMDFCRADARQRFDIAQVCRQIEALVEDAAVLTAGGTTGSRTREARSTEHSRSRIGEACSCAGPQRSEGRHLGGASDDEAAISQTPPPRCKTLRDLGAPPGLDNSKSEDLENCEKKRNESNGEVTQELGSGLAIMMLGFLPPGFRGGYRIRIEQEIKTLVKQGVRVHLACLHPETVAPAALNAHRSELAALGCKVDTVPMPGFFDIKLDPTAVASVLDTLQNLALARNLKVIHAEALYCARIGLLLRERSPGLRLVFDCHGTTPEEERMSGAHSARISAMQDWERRVLLAADVSIFVSGAMHEFYRERYQLPAIAHKVVPCCVAEERFATEAAVAPSASLGLPEHRPIVVYVGTLAAWQCGEEMIRLFAQLQRYDSDLFFLLLVPKADHTKARSLLQRYGLREQSVRLTELAHDQVAPALGHCHAGVLLRRAHPVNRVSSPTKFGEYLAAGVPVIMTQGIGDCSRIAADGGVGLVLNPDFLDRAELSSHEVPGIIDFVFASVENRQELSARCRRAANDHLRWEAARSALIGCYRQIAGS